MMNGHGKSHSPIVPTKPSNKAVKGAEGAEGRGLAEGNSREQNAPRTQGRNGAPSALERVRYLCRLVGGRIPVHYLNHPFYPGGRSVRPEAGAV